MPVTGDSFLAFARRVIPQFLFQRIRHTIVRRSFEGLVSSRIASTANRSDLRKTLAMSYFTHREKIDVTMSAATSWYGGDYFEFGSGGLHTFRDMLSAFDISGLEKRFPDTRFYAFDCFGKIASDDAATHRDMTAFDARTSYFSMQFPDGDDLPRHQAMLEEHGLYVDRCHLVQGLFQDTLNAERAARYRAEGRQIGYAFIDCNFEEFYAVVFRFIFDLMAPHSYIYMDEYFQAPGCRPQFDEFAERLRKERGIECMFVRSAGAFGGLFRLRPTSVGLAPLWPEPGSAARA